MNTLLAVLLVVGPCSGSYILTTVLSDFYRLPLLTESSVSLEACRERGDIEALIAAKNAMIAYNECLNNHREIEATLIAANGSFNSEVKEMLCRQSSFAENNCTNELITKVGPCASRSDMEAMKLFKNLGLSMHDYLCSNNRIHMTRIYSTLHDMSNCTRKAYRCAYNIRDGSAFTSHTLLTFEKFLLSPKGCGLRTGVEACVTQVSSECYDDAETESVLGLLNAVVEQIPACSEDDNIINTID